MLQLASDVTYAWAPPMADGRAPVYMTPGYQSMLAANDRTTPRVLACRSAEATTFLPMLVRELENGAKEAYSAYGYGGLFGNLDLSPADVDGLTRHLAEDGIVALFIRHSPFLANQQAWPSPLVKLNRRTYAVDLRPEDTFDACLARAPQKIRWAANFALRAGLRVTFHPLATCPAETIGAFHEQYHALMTEKETSDYYLFSKAFFMDHAARLGDACELAELTDAQGQFLGGAFFLKDGMGWAHYHLSAVRRDAMKLQGMEILIQSAIHRYGQQGLHALHLGGGHALDESDGLSRFKSKFATRTLDFCCSTLVCDEDGYRRARAAQPLANPSFFLISDARGH
jgi:hypothetical protein